MSLIGRTVGEYLVTDYVGNGQMGEVYKARHVDNDTIVALKFLPEHLLADPDAKRRFMRGAQAWAALDHPNICRFYGAAETPEGRSYVVLSFCEGETLQAKIARGTCDMRETLEIIRDVAAGLAHAHKKGVVHRDIKPANLMFDRDGVVKIVDFGLAKFGDASSQSSTNASPGTLLYMSPEQIYGDKVDGRSDIFALGGVLYEMLAGRHPFYAERPPTVMFQIGNDYPQPLREIEPEVPESLQEVIDRALQKDPQMRYQTAGEMRDNLQAVIDGGHLPKQKRPRRKRIKIVASAAVASAITTAIVLMQREPVPVGVAVVAAASTGTPEERALALGLAHDLCDRARFFARDDHSIWVVTPDRLAGVEFKTPEDIHNLLGPNLVITVRPSSSRERLAFELQGYGIASPPVLHERLLVDCDARSYGDSIDVSMRTLIGVDSRRQSPGYTGDGDAYRAYLIGLGHLDAKTRSLDRGIASLERAVRQDSTFARAWAALGDAYRLQSIATKDSVWSEKAAASCRRALTLVDDLAEAQVTMGQLFAARNDAANATKSYRRALAKDARNNFAYWRLADVHSAGGHDSDAEAAYAAAAKANPGDPAPRAWLGWYRYTLGHYRDAIAPLKEISRITPTNGSNYNMLGACYFAIDCWENATAMFEKSFDLERSYMACANLGTLYYMNHQYEDATRMYEWALEYNPSDYSTVGAIGAAQYWTEGQREQGIASYREAARLLEEALKAGESALLLADLSGYYAVIGHDSTVTVAERALALEPANPDVLFRVAMTYEHIGKRPKALALLRTCLQRKYSVRHIENEPFLAELRKDSRYQRLVDGLMHSEACEDL
ncbi:MAG TPA: protein kinase [Candidatus Krumholzibacteria bacterium]|nr:protein kinase [Candidatus Krumholzibacteria bacterium]